MIWAVLQVVNTVYVINQNGSNIRSNNLGGVHAHQFDDGHHATDEGEYDGKQEQTASHKQIHTPECHIKAHEIRKQCIQNLTDTEKGHRRD